jgi:hypothetical protein
VRCHVPSPRPHASPRGSSLAVPRHLEDRWDMCYLCSIGPAAERTATVTKCNGVPLLLFLRQTLPGWCQTGELHSFVAVARFPRAPGFYERLEFTSIHVTEEHGSCPLYRLMLESDTACESCTIEAHTSITRSSPTINL